MTERLLLLRTAATARYVILGTDYPCARVFDSTTSSLVAVLQPSKRESAGVQVVGGVTLTAVAVGSCPQKNRKRPSAEVLETFYAAAGLSNGTVIVHNIDANEAVGEVLVSPTQMPVQSLSICDGFLWCLGTDQKVSLINLRHPEDGVCFQFSAQSNASAITVISRRETSTAGTTSNDSVEEDVFDVLVAGSTTSLFAVTVHRVATTGGKAGMRSRGSGLFRVEKGTSYASQGVSVSFAWLSATRRKEGRAAVTASAAESTIRIWDVQSAEEQAACGSRSTEGAANLLARCRRTLVCGQRIADVSVLESEAGCFISATTFTGAVLIWDLGAALLPHIAEPLPLSPDIILYSAAAVGRLLLCQLIPLSGLPQGNPRDNLSALLVRGRFALPCFEQVTLGKLPSQVSNVSRPQQHRAKLALLSSLAITSSSVVALKEVPLSAALRESLELQDSVLRKSNSRRGGEAGAFDALDDVWAKQHVVAVATKANLTPTEAFPLAKAYRAQSTAALPVKSMTLEQRIRQVAQEHHVGDGDTLPAPQSLGLATVPLYQALHANDVAAVMELLSVAARTPEGMRATVMSLELPYCLQLLGIISERLGICSRQTASGAHSSATTVVGGGIGAISSRSPLLQWIDAIVHYRGMEMFEYQRAYDAHQSTSSPSDGDATATATSSPPKDFIAPILHQYRRMTKMYDSLATLHGRIGAFLGVRPSEKNRFVNRSRKMLSSNLDIGVDKGVSASSGILQSDMVFPAMFAEVASRKKGNYTIRVHNKAALALSRRKKLTRDEELLRQAKRRAAEELREKRQGQGLLDKEEDDVWDDVMMEQMAAGGEEGLMEQLQEMEALDLDDSDEEEEDEDNDSEDDDSEVSVEDVMGNKSKKKAGVKKRQRMETDEVLAQDNSDDESASSDVDFSEGSDEQLDSGAASNEDEGEDEESSSEDEEVDNDVDSITEGALPSSEDDDEEDDGMTEDMQELLEQTGSTGGAQAREKRVKVD